MGFLDKLKKTEKVDINVQEGKIYAPVTGRYIHLEDVEDEVFSSGMLGKGCGIIPEEGKVYAPVSGKISMVADTKHAIGITTDDGAEYVLHIGIDTVKMGGKGFEVKVKSGDRVNAGELLVKFDIKAIEDSGYQTTTMIILTNPDQYKNFTMYTDCNMKAGSVAGNI